MSLTYNPYMYQHHCILKSQTSRWDANFPTTSEEFYAYGLYQTELFDYSKAFDAFLKARDLKSIKALFMLGRCYQSGLGTSQSMDTAVSFFSAYCEETLKLISMGTSLSEEQNYHLGYCYLYGLGLAVDSQKAYDLFLHSSNHDALSCHELGNMMQQGCGHLLQDLEQASKWYLKAYELLYGPSLFSHYKIFSGKIEDYPFLDLLKTGYSYELGRYMRVAKENPSQDSYLRLATHYELGYPGDTPEGYAASIKKAEKYRKLSNNFN